MVSKSSAVRSIRLQNDLWSWLSEEAQRRGVTVNGLIGDLVLVARLKAAEVVTKPTQKPPKPVAKQAPEAVPKVEAASDRPAFKSRLKGEWKAP